MNKDNVRQRMTHFLTHSSLNTLNASKKYLISLRNTIIEGFTITESRSVWFSLMFYKFREENNVSDELYSAARLFLLDTISLHSEQETYVRSARNYLEIFERLKKEDRRSLLDEIVSHYLDVLHLKESIEQTRNQSTIDEWKDNYQRMLITIRESASKIGLLRELDKKVEEIERSKRTIVQQIMERAYWDMIERDIKNRHLSTFIAQLVELKEIVKYIIPKRYYNDLNDRFDIELIKQRLECERKEDRKEDDEKDDDLLIDTFRWVLESLKEWDSPVLSSLYERELITWEGAKNTLEWCQFLRFSLELCTLLALDSKVRKSQFIIVGKAQSEQSCAQKK